MVSAGVCRGAVAAQYGFTVSPLVLSHPPALPCCRDEQFASSRAPPEPPSLRAPMSEQNPRCCRHPYCYDLRLIWLSFCTFAISLLNLKCRSRCGHLTRVETAFGSHVLFDGAKTRSLNNRAPPLPQKKIKALQSRKLTILALCHTSTGTCI